MTIEDRIKGSEVYSFYVRNPKIFVGTGLTAMDLLAAFANANAGGKKIRYINNVCEHLKTNHTILCDDKLLREVVTKVYEKISYYEKMEYDFSDIHPCCLPWHARHFQSRMQGKFWFISQTKKDYSFSLSYESVFFFGDFNLYYIYCLPIAYFG